MNKLTVICVGRLKEKYLTEAVGEYAKRIGRFSRLELVEVKDEPTAAGAEARVLEREGERIISRIPAQSYVVALCVEGRQMSSTELAEKMRTLSLSGSGHMTVIIGGSLGLSEEVKKRAQLRLSFSRMTFPHQLMRVILLEQLYRALTINNNVKYHK
ncbi:MAG TPA: 23S rRNA (pseudouridine(1915)-N(3))-methyltransferase RlmH [Candidatus Monoglobus merdigallinarum]|uniref:Ribosomal RNA large subunit methyltransferase H n=1 Tax=Candidatus Monoglobus merdigallinarum TaxID=2838698 RepID=A0A9D1PPT8_9FIRM|nr:23S rRNA (pseudouridine(1915)-N(3))-methyltransferase RlmH [Candidatus Monoglobus merdigallinarum]